MGDAYIQQTGGPTWKLDSDEILLGREAPAAIVIDMPVVSRQHMRIKRHSKGYELLDLGSRNGTFVNGKPAGDLPIPLQDGDEIVVGGAVSLRFHDPGETREGRRVGRLRGVWIDPQSREVWVDAVRLEPPLSAAQQQFLELLYSGPGKLFNREQVVEAVWPDTSSDGVSEEAIDGLLKRLRARMGEGGKWIRVERGRGFRLAEPES